MELKQALGTAALALVFMLLGGYWVSHKRSSSIKRIKDEVDDAKKKVRNMPLRDLIDRVNERRRKRKG